MLRDTGSWAGHSSEPPGLTADGSSTALDWQTPEVPFNRKFSVTSISENSITYWKDITIICRQLWESNPSRLSPWLGQFTLRENNSLHSHAIVF